MLLKLRQCDLNTIYIIYKKPKESIKNPNLMETIYYIVNHCRIKYNIFFF